MGGAHACAAVAALPSLPLDCRMTATSQYIRARDFFMSLALM
ncbi:Uncharacterised protein [Mycobacteroides abscessus subsp. abscessus]|nr:Uncharacterised protein [Mycobacteroides abscessus subsp. abscessus]